MPAAWSAGRSSSSFPSGFVMLALQGVSEVIKRIAALQNLVTIDAKYERPMQ